MPKSVYHCTFALLFAATGCSRLTVIGVSGQHEEASAPLSQSAPRYATEISALPEDLLGSAQPALGDIDGDGYDDFLLAVGKLDGDVPARAMTAYLFYGRPSFGEKLSVYDADASFDTESSLDFAVGDVNGDGLADFVLTSLDGFEIVLGNSTRWSGHHAKLSTGLTVTYPYTELSGGLGVSSAVNNVIPVGDVNGDGKDDIAVSLTGPDADTGNVYGVGYADYIVFGREDGWRTGQWDPSFADISFGTYGTAPLRNRLMLSTHGDIDGDGRSDLLCSSDNGLYLFYGKPDLHGTLTSDQIDAELIFEHADLPRFLGDLDADGADDLAVVQTNQIGIFYGSHTRYSGRVTRQVDLSYTGKGPYNSVSLADTNGDGKTDLLFWADLDDATTDSLGGIDAPTSPRLYEVRGTGKRVTGEVRGTTSTFQAVGYTAPAAISGGAFSFTAAGDLDGDGSSDLMVATVGETDTSTLYYVLPGAGPDPQ